MQEAEQDQSAQRKPSPRPGTAFTDIDLDGAGRQLGHVFIPHSPHDDAWGAVAIPIAVIGNGDGPTVLLTGGNHGDEYEGPIALGELIRETDPATVAGRLIILPAMNRPAVAAGRRVSPDDGLNFNRTFPGDPHGSITRQISAFVHDHLFARADAFIDLHSGGSSLRLLPSAIVEPAPDPAHTRRNWAAVRAFDAPYTVVIDNLGDPRTASAAAVRAGLTVVGTELAGAGTVTREALAACRRGVRRVLAHLGVIEGDRSAPVAADRTYALPGTDAYVLATADGVFEPMHALGDPVRRGELAGRIHMLTDPGRPPVELRYRADGILFGLRQPGRAAVGNCCAVVAAPHTGITA